MELVMTGKWQCSVRSRALAVCSTVALDINFDQAHS